MLSLITPIKELFSKTFSRADEQFVDVLISPITTIIAGRDNYVTRFIGNRG